jgi:hypothetical protein
VAARAELRRIGIRGLALRALHGSIVAGSRASASGMFARVTRRELGQSRNGGRVI